MKVNHTNRRYLSIWEAEALLPKLKYYVSEMMRLRRGIINLSERVKACGGRLKFDDGPVFSCDPATAVLEKKLYDMTNQYKSVLGSITRIGAVVDDADIAAFDFYTLFDSEEILLCWQYGEDKIEYWHFSNEGFRERRHMEELFSQADFGAPAIH